MPALIGNLKNEHEKIVNALTQAREAGFSNEECFERLREVKLALVAHLAEEDAHLYPTLFEAAKTDTALKSTLGIFAQDMHEVSRQVLAFFEKYEDGGSGVEFASDFGRLYALLDQRIRKEEEILYPEYDKLRP